MLRESSISAKGVFLRREETIKALKTIAAKVKIDYPEVREIRLFGSLAKGNHGPGSDADLLIILEKNNLEHPEDRIPQFLWFFLKAPLPVEVFPYTKEEISQMLRRGNRFIRNALEESIDLCR